MQIVHTQGYGGLERQVLSLSRGLRDAGHAVTLAVQEGSWLQRQAEVEHLEWAPLRFRGLIDPVSHLRLRRLVRERGIDVVHGHSRRSAFYSALARGRGSCRSVATVHSLSTWKGFQRNQRMIAVSEAVREFLIQKGLPAARIERIYNGVDALPEAHDAERRAAREQLGLAPGRLAVGMVGRMVPHKGHDLLVRALSLLGAVGEPMDLVLIGDATGTWPDELQQLINRLGLDARVRLPGYQGKVAGLLRGLDAFVQPSRSEALSLSLLEAMAAGLPVIAARTGGMPEVIEDGVNGLLFASEDAHALAWQLKKLLDPALRERLGRQARRTQRERFSASAMTDATVSLYRRLLEQPA
ncbi:glycosyltransferase family 4 protein [Pseudoxanthomonas beigongshangi]